MEFGIYGMPCKEVSVDVRDRTALSDTQKMELYNRLLGVDITWAVTLSACNHSELCFIYEKEEQLDQIRELFLAAAGKAIPLPLKIDVTAACYLFEVVVGYHPMMFGESQILGQVRSYYQMANQRQACGKQLYHIFQSYFAAIKQLKTAYKVSEHPISIAHLAVRNIRNAISLRNASVLAIGSGEMAALTSQYLQEEELSTLYTYSRSRYKTRRVMSAAIEYIPSPKRCEVLPYCDVICSTTASPHRIPCREDMPPIDRKQLYADLAMPRDIDPQLAQRGRVVIDIDHLQREADEQLGQRKALLQKAHAMLETVAQEAYTSLHSQGADHLIRSLQQRNEQMAADTYALPQAKLQLSPYERQVLKKVLHTSLLRMVKESMLTLRKARGQDRQLCTRLLETMLRGGQSYIYEWEPEEVRRRWFNAMR